MVALWHLVKDVVQILYAGYAVGLVRFVCSFAAAAFEISLQCNRTGRRPLWKALVDK